MKINPTVGFSGAKEQKLLVEAIANNTDGQLVKSARAGVFNGIIPAEIKSKEVKAAVDERIKGAIFPESIQYEINRALEILMKPFQAKK